MIAREVAEPLDTGVVIADRFELVRRLGRGSTGVVWSAKDRASNQTVAIKILHANVLGHQALVENLRREIEVLETLHHRHVARPIDFFGGPPTPYLAMELVEGPTLDRLLGEHAQEGTQLSWEHTLAILDQLFSAIHHAHKKYIVHRDLKPQNIALASTLRGPAVKVLDFGIAKFLEGGLFDATTLGRRLGSLYYMSPEQVRGEPADVRSDVFALGAVAFEVLTLHRAWPRDEDGGFLPAFTAGVPRIPANAIATVAQRISTEERPRASELRDLPETVDGVLTRAMAILPEDRFASAMDLRNALMPHLAKAAGLDPTIIEDKEEETVLAAPEIDGDTRVVSQEVSTVALPTRTIDPLPAAEPPPELSFTWLFAIIALCSAVSVVAIGVLIQSC